MTEPFDDALVEDVAIALWRQVSPRSDAWPELHVHTRSIFMDSARAALAVAVPMIEARLLAALNRLECDDCEGEAAIRAQEPE